MAFKLSNFARMSLVQSAGLGDTVIFVAAEDAEGLPILGPGDFASAVIYDNADREIVYITANDGGGLTVLRGQENTAARDWAAGVRMDHTPTAAVILSGIASAEQFVFSGSATNIGNAYTVNVGVGQEIPILSDGELISFIIPATNTGAATLVVTNGTESTTSAPIRKEDNQPLVSDDLVLGWLAVLRYSATAGSWLLSNLTSTQFNLSKINEGPVPAINRHSNGRLAFWNNGTSFPTPASLAQTADGWYVQYDGTIGIFTVNRQAFTPGQTEVPDNPRYWIRWDQSSAGSGSTIRRLFVRIPGAQWRAGARAIRRVWMKADAARNVTSAVVQHFGTGGAPSADVVAFSAVHALTTSWQVFDLTGLLPSISGKTFGSSGDDAIILRLDLPLNVTMSIDIAMDDFRQGVIAGTQSETFPLPTSLGGTGGSFEDLNDVLASATNVVHTTGNETIAGIKTFTSDQVLSAATPRYRLFETDQAVDEKQWDLILTGGDLQVRTRTDADGAGVTALSFIRGAGTVVTSITSSVPILAPAGSAAAPAIASSGDPNTGFEFPGTDNLHVVTAGARAANWNATGDYTQALGQMLMTDGAVTLPGYSFSGDPNTGRYRIGADNVGEATNGVLRFDWNTVRLQLGVGFDIVLPLAAIAPTSVFSAGYRGAPVVSGNSAYAFPAADAGHTVYHDEAGTRTWTIPANASVAHPIGTVFILDNTGNSGAAGAITVAITTDTLRRGDGTSGTGSRTVPASAVAVIRKVSATVWVITGVFT